MENIWLKSSDRALVLGYTVFPGLNSTIFVNGTVNQNAVSELLGVANTGFAASILERLTVSWWIRICNDHLTQDQKNYRTARPLAEVEREWGRDHGQFKANMTNSINPSTVVVRM